MSIWAVSEEERKSNGQEAFNESLNPPWKLGGVMTKDGYVTVYGLSLDTGSRE
jgi:hypothetical protein